MQPDPAILEDLVKQVVAAVQPLRIILFGSAARGEMTSKSDLDVLVVVPDGSNQNHVGMKLYRSVSVGMPKDFVVATLSDLEKYGESHYTPIYYALKEGKELYRASAA